MWTIGIPTLAYGLTFNRLALVSGAGWTLFVAVLCVAVNVVLITRHAFADPVAADAELDASA